MMMFFFTRLDKQCSVRSILNAERSLAHTISFTHIRHQYNIHSTLFMLCLLLLLYRLEFMSKLLIKIDCWLCLDCDGFCFLFLFSGLDADSVFNLVNARDNPNHYVMDIYLCWRMFKSMYNSRYNAGNTRIKMQIPCAMRVFSSIGKQKTQKRIDNKNKTEQEQIQIDLFLLPQRPFHTKCVMNLLSTNANIITENFSCDVMTVKWNQCLYFADADVTLLGMVHKMEYHASDSVNCNFNSNICELNEFCASISINQDKRAFTSLRLL